MGIAETLAVGFVARQAATALAYTRQQLGKTDRTALFAHLKPGFRVLEIGPGEGACHRHWPPGLHYTAVDAPLTKSAGRASTPLPELPELPVQATCESFSLLRGAWQELLPELASGKGRGSFDSVVVVMPSTIYFGPDQGLASGVLRTGLRLPRPRAEWETLVRTARALLAPGGTLLTTDVSSAHSLVAAALLPLSQRRPPLGEAVLRREFCGSFGRVEVVAEPVHAFDEPEIQLRAHAA
uniref:Uncharacterized protein n=1 Tax=Phaeocystis antarctica TaxID=33657 RepID=A0A7S0DXG4_9EUKA|mmetsp:Transcript_11736/g.27616  ORF Transcript_11736/g.27616 Transcript_11736/m.27616 type:complete len:240 (+) Transcript_11736:40-759(+)